MRVQGTCRLWMTLILEMKDGVFIFQMLDLLEPTTTTDSPTKGQRDRIKNCVGQVQLFIEVIRRYGAAAQIRHLFQLFELCFLYEMA